MKTLILFASKHGCTQQAASRLAQQLSDADLRSVSQLAAIDLADYETVIVGGSIYVGQLDKALVQYLFSQMDVLRQQRVGLFVCCGQADKALEQLRSAFPSELVQLAVAQGYFGYSFQGLSLPEKLICKALKAPVGKTEIRDDQIAAFAAAIRGA